MLPPVQSLLANDATVTALVGTNIFQVRAPQDITRPFVTWELISTVPGYNLSCLPEYDSQRVRVDCYSEDLAEARTICEACRDALEAYADVVFGPWTPPMDKTRDDIATRLHRWSFDVKFHEYR